MNVEALIGCSDRPGPSVGQRRQQRQQLGSKDVTWVALLAALAAEA